MSGFKRIKLSQNGVFVVIISPFDIALAANERLNASATQFFTRFVTGLCSTMRAEIRKLDFE
jgi:hypothetical protein